MTDKEEGQRNSIPYKGPRIRLTLYISVTALDPGSQSNVIIRIERKEPFQSRILKPAKLSFKHEVILKIFLGK